MSTATRKSQGFAGERIMEIPKETVEKCRRMPLINHLFITRMGFYPKARHHYYQRPAGISQVILLYCTDGQGWVQLPKSRVILHAGEVFAIAPGTPYSYGADAANPWTIYWFHLGGINCKEAVSALMNEQANPAQGLRVGFAGERIALFDQILNTFLKGYSTSNLLYANLAIPFFLASLIVPEHFHPETVASGPPNPTNQAIRYVQNHLSEPVALDNIAQAAHLSMSFFAGNLSRIPVTPPLPISITCVSRKPANCCISAICASMKWLPKLGSMTRFTFRGFSNNNWVYRRLNTAKTKASAVLPGKGLLPRIHAHAAGVATAASTDGTC